MNKKIAAVTFILFAICLFNYKVALGAESMQVGPENFIMKIKLFPHSPEIVDLSEGTAGERIIAEGYVVMENYSTDPLIPIDNAEWVVSARSADQNRIVQPGTFPPPPVYRTEVFEIVDNKIISPHTEKAVVRFIVYRTNYPDNVDGKLPIFTNDDFIVINAALETPDDSLVQSSQIIVKTPEMFTGAEKWGMPVLVGREGSTIRYAQLVMLAFEQKVADKMLTDIKEAIGNMYSTLYGMLKRTYSLCQKIYNIVNPKRIITTLAK